MYMDVSALSNIGFEGCELNAAAAMLVRSKHHFKILGSKVHLRKSSNLRCHYDSPRPALDFLVQKVFSEQCVYTMDDLGDDDRCKQ